VNPFVKASQLKTKVNGYSVARSHALNHQTLQHLAAHHREKFLKAFKYVQANVVSNITVSHGIASTKHDGVSAYFFWEKGHQAIIFHAPSFGLELGLPAAEELAEALERAGHTSALLAGELVANGSRSHSYEVIRALNSPQSQADLDKVRLVLFDIILLDHQEKQHLSYAERAKVLQGLPKTGKAFAADFLDVKSLDELNTLYRAMIAAGHEGIVLHELSTHTAYKIKPKFNIDLAIVGFVEGTEQLTGHAVSIMGALMKEDSCQLVARVGVADPVLREPLFKELSRHRIESSYLETDSDSRPIVWVKPTRVMEINAEDVVWEDARGGQWTNAVLRLDKGKFFYQGEGLIFKPFHPTLERLRDDKLVAECTFAQMPGTELKVKQVTKGEPAQVFQREVFTKTLKGKTAIKKVVAWAQQREGFPGYVIHTTDFSADRAEPLKEDTKATDDKHQAEAYVKAWKEEEIGKGWNKI